MPLMISRIGHSRGLPVALGFGKCGAMTRHSASVRSVWYRVTMRLCCRRVVSVHMANPRLVQEPPRNHGGHHDSGGEDASRAAKARGCGTALRGVVAWGRLR